jgi:restriction system protein
MAEKVRGLLNGLVKFPWWGSMFLSAAVYAALFWVVPLIIEGQSLLRPLTPFAERMAPAAAFLMLISAAVSAYHQICKGWLLERPADVGAGEGPKRRQFESLVGEAFRRQGYMVLHRIEDGPGRGANIWLRKNGQVAFVQCKHWKARTVGVEAVRELSGIMATECVQNGIIVTCGSFTLDAVELARGSSIALIDGPRLMQLITFQQQSGYRQAEQEAAQTSPRHGSGMVPRVAGKGPYGRKAIHVRLRSPECRSLVAAGGSIRDVSHYSI